MKEEKQRVRIEEWGVVHGCLVGNVYGHSDFKDGDIVITSRISGLDVKKSEAETLNTVYVLGVPSPYRHQNIGTFVAKAEEQDA